jgi:hypothetical protein
LDNKLKNKNMEQHVAKQLISEALNIAISKGCFNLTEVTNIVRALEKINEEAVEEPTIEVEEETKK